MTSPQETAATLIASLRGADTAGSRQKTVVDLLKQTSIVQAAGSAASAAKADAKTGKTSSKSEDDARSAAKKKAAKAAAKPKISRSLETVLKAYSLID